MPRTTSQSRRSDLRGERHGTGRRETPRPSRATRSASDRGARRARGPAATQETEAPASRRAFWKGRLSFGLVEVPIRLRPAVRNDDLHFTQLDKRDLGPVGYRRYNKVTGREVPWDDIVRGYEYEPDSYVVVTDADLERANVEATHAIEILDFVDRDAVEPIYFDTPYYVEPESTDSKSFRLLRAALEHTHKLAIARLVLKTRQHLAALLVRDGAMMLDLLRYAHEIQPAGRARGADADVDPRELRMAERLIEDMSATWNPSQYRDAYRDDVIALVEQRVKEGKTEHIDETPAPAPRRSRQVIDLMDLLKQSLEAREGASRRQGTSEAESQRRGPSRARAKPASTRRRTA